jgi:hypothetical protein
MSAKSNHRHNLRPMTLHTVNAWLLDAKATALQEGRYGPPFTAENFDNRDKSKAVPTIAYNQSVRRINALQEMADFVNQHTASKNEK